MSDSLHFTYLFGQCRCQCPVNMWILQNSFSFQLKFPLNYWFLRVYVIRKWNQHYIGLIMWVLIKSWKVIVNNGVVNLRDWTHMWFQVLCIENQAHLWHLEVLLSGSQEIRDNSHRTLDIVLSTNCGEPGRASLQWKRSVFISPLTFFPTLTLTLLSFFQEFAISGYLVASNNANFHFQNI